MVLQLNIYRSLIILIYPNTADEINKQNQYEEDQKIKLDIVVNER